MKFRERIENNPVAWLIGTSIAGFLAGIAAYDGILGIARLDVVPRDSYLTKTVVSEKYTLKEASSQRVSVRGLEEIKAPGSDPSNDRFSAPKRPSMHGYVLTASVRQTSGQTIRVGVTVQMRTQGMIRHRDDIQAGGDPLSEGALLKVRRLAGEWLEVEVLDKQQEVKE